MLTAFAILGVLAAALYAGLMHLHSLVRRKMVAQQTGLLDLPLLGESRKDAKKIKGTAVICGGSIAGLAAARVCHDHFERVIIIEPEGWLSTEEGWTENVLELKKKRSRILQWDSYQVIQVWGTWCLEKLFPTFAEACAASRIPLVPGDLKISIAGQKSKVPLHEYNGKLPQMVSATRPAIETLLRRLVIGRKQYPGIQQIPGIVAGFDKDPDKPSRLNKVLVRRNNDEMVAIPATLILDCTGPASASIKMIRGLGFGIADGGVAASDKLTAKYDQNLHYSTLCIPVTNDQIQRFPEEYRAPGPIFVCFPDLGSGERGTIASQRLDNGIVQLGAGYWGACKLPTSLQEFETFALSRRVETPIPESWFQVIDILKESEDKMKAKTVRIPPSTFTHFHRAANLPSNLIAIGDSVMRLNPIFGQGINKALLGVSTLNTLLHAIHSDYLPEDFAKEFFKIQSKKIEPIWDGVKCVDYGFDGTKPSPGETLSTGSWLLWYIRHVNRLATKDEQVGAMVWHQRMFLAPPFDLLRPDIAFKVLWEGTKESIARSVTNLRRRD